jgi:hypothetical protein
MRRTHFPNPFHRIECWNGSYFQQAALWEVGVYLRLDHHQAPTVCSNIKWQSEILENFQRRKDEMDRVGNDGPVHERPHPAQPGPDAEPGPDAAHDSANDEAVIQMLDHLLGGHDPQIDLEEEEEGHVNDHEADVGDADAGVIGFAAYIAGTEADQDEGILLTPKGTPTAPREDALNNHYVRVVHTNGIHHIALLSCTCRGT